MNERLLIVEDEETLCDSLKRVLSREGYIVDTANSAESALEIFEHGFYDLIITDIILPGITGIELLRTLKERLPEQIVIITTAYASLETAVEALRTGAYDYVVKPVMHEEIKQIVKNALTQGALQAENVRLRKQVERNYDLSMVIGESPAMKQVLDKIKKITGGKRTILLQGEIGTGRELIARAIHLNSGRNGKPFIPVTLKTIPADILESRLFGCVKDTCKDVTTANKGLFEEANGGTIFIREIADLDADLQTKLLRVMEQGEITPVGGNRGIKVDLQFIVATHRDIDSLAEEGTFSNELLGRINEVSITLPPLRERKEDIGLLATHFIERYSHDFCKQVNGIDRKALEALVHYPWPGNVRELRNIIERAVLIEKDEVITPETLPPLVPQA
jgi:DNA-binding NtrC family response regulator